MCAHCDRLIVRIVMECNDTHRVELNTIEFTKALKLMQLWIINNNSFVDNYALIKTY